MKNKQYKLDIIPGIVLAVFSIAYLSMIPSIQTFTGLGSTPLTNHFIPYLWGGVVLFFIFRYVLNVLLPVGILSVFGL